MSARVGARLADGGEAAVAWACAGCVGVCCCAAPSGSASTVAAPARSARRACDSLIDTPVNHASTAVREAPLYTGLCVMYTCPMHPEIVRSGPGACPICGMPLEP